MPQLNQFIHEIQPRDVVHALDNIEIPASFKSDGVLESDQVYKIAITSGGAGYTANFAVTATGGGGSGFAGTAIVIGGAVVEVIITDPGHGYTSDPTPDFSAGAGTGATATASRLVRMGAMGFYLGQMRSPLWGQGLNACTFPGDPRNRRKRRNFAY